MEVCEVFLLQLVELFRVEQNGLTMVGFRLVVVASGKVAGKTETVFDVHNEVPVTS